MINHSGFVFLSINFLPNFYYNVKILNLIFKGYISSFAFYLKKGTSRYIRDYMLNLAGHKCQICSWCEINPSTNKSPLT